MIGCPNWAWRVLGARRAAKAQRRQAGAARTEERQGLEEMEEDWDCPLGWGHQETPQQRVIRKEKLKIPIPPVGPFLRLFLEVQRWPPPSNPKSRSVLLRYYPGPTPSSTSQDLTLISSLPHPFLPLPALGQLLGARETELDPNSLEWSPAKACKRIRH